MSYTQQLGDNPYHLYDKIIMTDNPIGILALKTFTYVARLNLVLAFVAKTYNECKLYIIADDLIELISQSIYKSFIEIRHRFLEFKELIDLIPKSNLLPIIEPISWEPISCEPISWDLYLGNLYLGNLYLGNLYLGNLYLGNL